jgi:SAM-dependent methyltransferase
LVPLLRHATKDADEAMLEAISTLTAAISGYGERTLRIGVGDASRPLALRYVPLGMGTGTRLWPSARLSMAICASGWAGLHLEGRSVLELGCGSGAAGLACASLGARAVWLTDADDAVLALAAKNVQLNAELSPTTRVARLDFTDAHATPPVGMPEAFDLILAADLLYSMDDGMWRMVLRALARFLKKCPNARALCTFGRDGRRVEAALRNIDEFDRVLTCGESEAEGLRVLARAQVACKEGDGEGDILALLIARQV